MTIYVQLISCYLYISLAASPPAPSAPYALSIASTSITLGWDSPTCDGGHRVTGFVILYAIGTSIDRWTQTFTVTVTGGTQRNYTVTGLQASTDYIFRIQAISADHAHGPYSPYSLTLRTLIPGIHCCLL